MATTDQNIKLDAQNPWPGLPAYNEAGRDFFYGRDAEIEELLRLVRLAPLTALYSKSGLGKSSLLQAGVFPRLRDGHYLPVYILLDVSETAEGSAQEQAARKLQAELEAQGADFPAFEPGESLWRYLHRGDLELWSKDNYLLTPVLVFDQFEEIFSRGSADPERIRQTCYELADLIENRIPAEIASGEEGRRAAAQLDLRSRRYRVILSFREDFLPDIRNWERDIPSLLKNWLQIQPLDRERAIEAVRNAGDAILDPDAPEAIVDFIGNLDGSSDPGDTSVEPVLLSLCCYQLNRRRKKTDLINADMVLRLGPDILQDFYAEALAGMPQEVAEFIEDKLIQGDRYRGSYPLEGAIKERFIERKQLGDLVGRRLLRIDRQRGIPRIELIHDRLVGVVRRARDKRQTEEEERHRQTEEEERRRQAEDRAELERARADAQAAAKRIAEAAAKNLGRQRKWLGYLSGILFAVMLWGYWQAYQARESRDKATYEARQSKSLQLAFRAQGILNGSQSGSDALAYLQILAANKLMPAGEASEEINAVLFSAIRNVRSLYRIVETEAPITAVVIDKAGKMIATGNADGGLRLWNAETGEAASPLLRGGGLVAGLAFSPGGSRLASGGNDRVLRLWEVGSGKLLGEQSTGHEKAVTGVAFSPDGKKIATSSLDQTLRLWDASTLQAIGGPLTGQDSGVTSVAFSPDGARLVSGSNDKALQLWDAATGKMLGNPMQGHTASVTSVAFSPDGKRIASGGEDQTVRLWNAKNGQLAGVLAGHEDFVTSVAFNADGTQIASGSQDQSVRLWDAASGQPIRAPLRGHAGLVSGVAFGLNGRLVSGGYDKTLRLWDAGISQLAGTGHNGTVATVAYSPDGRRIVTGSYDKTLRLRDAATGQPLGEPLRGHKAGVSSVAFSPDGSLIVSGSYDKTLILWDAAKRQALGQPLKGHWAGVSSVAFSPDGSRIVSGGDDGTVRLWALKPRPSMLLTIVGHSDTVTSVAFSPDGTKIVSGGNDRTVQVWNAADGKLATTLAGHEDTVTSVAFSPDGKYIVSGSWDSTVRLWDAETGLPARDPLTGHADWVSSVAFSPKGDMIVSGSRDRTLRLWDAHTGKSIGPPFSGHRKGVWSVAFSPDGKWIASGSGDKTLQLWRTSIDVSADELCKKLTRNMSREEWDETVSGEFNYVKQCMNLPGPTEDLGSTSAAAK